MNTQHGPSDWIRTSGRPTASPGPPCGEIEIQEAAGSRALAKKERQVLVIPVFLGPSDWIRTSGLLNPIQARYQTSPHPDLLRAL